MITNTKMFWGKNYTKRWLAENTTFSYPKNIVEKGLFSDTFKAIEQLPVGDYVWKPNIGRKSRGIMLFRKGESGNFTFFPEDISYDFEKTKDRITSKIENQFSSKKYLNKYHEWFIEEWIHPHERFHIFTDDIRCPPIIRFCGRDKVNFVVMSPIAKEYTGISDAGWEKRKYIWLDFEGNVRRKEEMNLAQADKHSIKSIPERSFEAAPLGHKVLGIPEIIEQIDREVSCKLRLYCNNSWCLDGIFNEQDQFVVIEMNHSPGTQFRGISWIIS